MLRLRLLMRRLPRLTPLLLRRLKVRLRLLRLLRRRPPPEATDNRMIGKGGLRVAFSAFGSFISAHPRLRGDERNIET